ncbi:MULTISPECIES: glucosylglycerol hydrolase [Haloarcula]|uniref:glucosylglycerol hydrolase n=1 Tax=Haloarcula TaxID=2237 RepID=UPI0023EB428C|nr:glucosylglycerol hydrolase [Halomicroarcula sp. XH51]
MTSADCTLLDAETAALADRQREVLDAHDDRFEAAKEVTTRLGAHWRDGHAEFGFWTPQLVDEVPADEVRLELLTAEDDVDLTADEQTVTFDRQFVETRREGEFTWAAVEGPRPGTREQLGTLYRLGYEVDGERESITDPFADSVPFGAYGPPELYDMDRLDEERADREYFQNLAEDGVEPHSSEDDGLPRFEPATSMLESHPGTATESGTLAGLKRQFDAIGEKLADDDADLTPAERNFVGYDAVQLMPVAPITQNEDELGYWLPSGSRGDKLRVDVRRPDMLNWGYDIVISGFGTVNPAILESRRPDELVDLIATLHTLPDPIKVVFDIALGHADNGALPLLNEEWFAGPGMYGQELDYTQPVVRAGLLELQRRKMDFGADGIRVDGAQDFTNWDPAAEEEWHDDEYLAEMDRVTQKVAGVEYRPWMIYEDGRPWPRSDWELASTYRTLIEQHPHAYQWGPVTFAHNTPALQTFWATKWWRVREVADMGENWISGVANHDTIRRGTQLEPDPPFSQPQINRYLGDTRNEQLRKAYNNPASSMLFHGFMPGCPMDFTHANMRAPWGFVRDTDAVWNLKVLSEEENFPEWQVRPQDFADDEHFHRLKAWGFESREELREFLGLLADVVSMTDYDKAEMVALLNAAGTPVGDEFTVDELEQLGRDWMRDMGEFFNLAHWHAQQDDERTAFDLAVREFRHDHEWVTTDLTGDDELDYVYPTDGTVLYYGFRRAPDESEEILFVATMEGVAEDVVPTDLVDVDDAGWEVALSSPDLDVADAGDPVELADSQAALFVRSLD